MSSNFTKARERGQSPAWPDSPSGGDGISGRPSHPVSAIRESVADFDPSCSVVASSSSMRSCPQCGSEVNDEHKFCPSCGFPIGKVAVNPDDPLIGRTLPGGYVILELVGIGGMGRVYRAEQKALGRTVAVKIIHPHLLGDESASVRFITEARAASRLNHPNSVGAIDFGKNGRQLYLVME